MTTEILEKIKQFVEKGMNDPHHDFSHLDRVRENALKFADILGVSEKLDPILLQAICYLHDIAYMRYKTGVYAYLFERMLVKRELKRTLPKFEICKEESEIIMMACVKHPYSFPFRQLNKNNDLYTKLLQDSDTADIFHQKRVVVLKKEAMKMFFLGKYLSILVDFGRSLGMRNIRKYLNFPELCEKINIG